MRHKKKFLYALYFLVQSSLLHLKQTRVHFLMDDPKTFTDLVDLPNNFYWITLYDYYKYFLINKYITLLLYITPKTQLAPVSHFSVESCHAEMWWARECCLIISHPNSCPGAKSQRIAETWCNTCVILPFETSNSSLWTKSCLTSE